MIFKIWAYSAGTIGIVLGAYIVFKEKHKSAIWIIFISLLIFFGGNLNIEEISHSDKDSFNIIREEIEDLKKLIVQFNRYSKTETFTKQDFEKRIKIFPFKKSSVIYFELANIPIPQAVIVADEYGTFSSTIYTAENNIIILRRKLKPDEILKDDGAFYSIKFYSDESSIKDLKTIQNMEYQGTEEDPRKAEFKKRID